MNSIGLSFFVREVAFIKDVALAPPAGPPTCVAVGAWGYDEVFFEFDVLFCNAAWYDLRCAKLNPLCIQMGFLLSL